MDIIRLWFILFMFSPCLDMLSCYYLDKKYYLLHVRRIGK